MGVDQQGVATARSVTTVVGIVKEEQQEERVMPFIKKTDRRRGRLNLLTIGALALFMVVLLVGCGDDAKDTSSAKGGTSKQAAVSDADLQKTVDQALSSTDIKAASLPPLMQDALKRATAPLSDAQQAKAFECWKANSCTLGDGKVTLAQVDTFGGNTWRQFTKMNVILEALTHPEVGKFIYSQANFDLATYQANIRTAVAQGAKAIVTNDEFGPAAYGALAAAERQGARISTYVGSMEEAPDNAYTTRVQFDLCATGTAMAQTVEKALSAKGPVAYLDGLAGNPQDVKIKACLAKEGVKPVFSEATDYTPAGSQKAASALIASGKPAKAILYSYANTVPSMVKAYLKAGKDIPAIITLTQANETNCQRVENPYPLYITNSANWAARVAVNSSVRAVAGEKVPKSMVFPLPFFEATKKDCDKSKPAEYPGPALVPETLSTQMLASK
jgi:ABC-type sugar transport system substrate-binding protein